MAGRVGFEPTLRKAQINSLLTKPLVYRPINVWEQLDSNQRTRMRGDLQSPAIAAMRCSLSVVARRIELRLQG